MRILGFLFTMALSAQTVDQLVPHRTTVAATTYRGRAAIKVVEIGDVENGEAYAMVKGPVFSNGTIEVEVAGAPRAGAAGGARGFIGVGFRRQSNGQYEHVYLRPTNGRADDQVRRNHSTQYALHPDFDFARLRKEAPEKYESYVDLEPGVWTKFKLVVAGVTAKLYVHGAEQPCLIVNDLKLGAAVSGDVLLWIGPGTEGYFANLKITRQSP